MDVREGNDFTRSQMKMLSPCELAAVFGIGPVEKNDTDLRIQS
jgi:hypothetical protein